MRRLKLLGIILLLMAGSAGTARAQFLMDMVDTTKTMGKGMLGLFKKYDNLKIGGYIQPQFQLTNGDGAKSNEGGDFSPQVDNRFLLRRSRIRIDYINFPSAQSLGLQIVFQFDANERGFTVRDVWGRIFENRFKLFTLTTGMFARPFGFELNYSSADRESPERGRMSQILMKGERDLGMMITMEARKDMGFLNRLKVDAGLFNGQGITATGDFDNIKDVIARIALKPVKVANGITLALGLSTLHGGLMQNTRYVYTTERINGVMTTRADSGLANLNGRSPRNYNGADAQLKIRNRVGYSELRAEFVTGKQTGTEFTSETPTTLLTGKEGFHIRNFRGAYLYYIQSLFSTKHQLVLKYDLYDPNTRTKGSDIGATGSNLSSANIRYQTFGAGYVAYLTENVKLMLYYSRVLNETTLLKGYTSDLKDDVFTCRLQYRF